MGKITKKQFSWLDMGFIAFVSSFVMYFLEKFL